MLIWWARISSLMDASVAGDVTNPGDIAFGPDAVGALSAASVLVSATTPPFAAAWAARPIGPMGRSADMEAVLMIEALPASRRYFHAG